MSKKRSKKSEPQQPPPPPPPRSEVEDEESQSEGESEPKHLSGKRKRENALGGETSVARQRSDTESEDEPPEPPEPPKKHARKGEENGVESSRKKRKKESRKDEEEKNQQDDEVVEVKPDAKPSSKKGWQPKDETALAKQMLADLKSNPDLDLRDKTRGDEYWGELCETLKGKLSNEFTEDQIFEKYKRMKIKFGDFEAHKTFKTGKRRNAELHEIYKQLWGGDEHAMTPGKAQAAHSDDSEDGETTGIPLLRPVKREVLENGFSPGLENGGRHTAKKAKPSEDALKVFSSQEQQHLGPAVNFGALLCNSVESMIKLSQDGLVKLLEATTEEDRKRRKEERRRMLKEQAAEYSRMKTRLRLVLEYCEQEEANVKKMLEEL